MSNIVTPIIDTLQTIPSFRFIIPVVMLFRVGDVTALISIVTFAGLGLLINFQQPSAGDFTLIDASSFNINLCVPS